MELIITSEVTAAATVSGDHFYLAGRSGRPLRLAETEGAEELLLTLQPCEGAVFLPLGCVLRREGNALRLDSPSPGVRLIDWGGGLTELIARFARMPQREPEPALLDRIEFETADGKAEIALYRDCGLRLSVAADGRETSMAVCGGTNGKLQALDVGGERLLILLAEGCFSEEDGQKSRIVALDGELRIAASMQGDLCEVRDGYLTAITALGTVSGHERRQRMELFSRAEKPQEARTDIGFFTHPRREPETAAETALAFLQCVKLGLADEAFGLLSAQLAEALDEETLFAFFGDFDEARLCPRQPDGGVTVGAVRGGTAESFDFTVENGRIADITAREAD